MSIKDLTGEELAAVLRCMRKTIQDLEREREVVVQRKDRNAVALLQIVDAELAVHRGAVRTLWNMPRRKPP